MKESKKRYSSSTRKPLVIEHEPVKPAHDAEPIAMDKSKVGSETMTRTDKQSQNTSKESAAAASKAEKMAPPSASSMTRGGSPWIAGLVGGLVVAIVAGGIHYSGLMSSTAPVSNQNAGQQIAAFKEEVASLQQALAANEHETASLKTALQQALERLNVENTAVDHSASENSERFNALQSSVSQLQTAIDGISAQSGNPEAIQALTARFSTFEEQLARANAALQRIDQVNQHADQAMAATVQLDNRLSALAKTVEEMPEKFANPLQGKELALLMAAHALKDAVDRGGSFDNEFQTFSTIAPDTLSLDALAPYTKEGLANQVALSAAFSKVADAIAATENKPDAQAGYGERLWASAKNIVTSRPVGNVEGNTPSAIAARMEVALNSGDYTKVLSEWEQLPDNAKAVSKDMIEKIRARQNADMVLSKIIAMALTPQDKTQNVKGQE